MSPSITRASINSEFAGHDEGPGPFEKDLVKGICGCLVVNKDQTGHIHLSYDKHQCLEAVHGLVAGETIGRDRPVSDSGTSFPLEAKLEPIRGVDWQSRLQRKDIDLYIGTLTKAAAREKGVGDVQGSQGFQPGMKFSTGYLGYRSELLIDPSDVCSGIKCLADQLARVCALEGSTNLQLADMLTQTSGLDNLKVVAFPSPAEMEGAYEKGEIRAVLIDDVLKSDMGLEHARVLDELFSQPGWSQYLNSYIGDKAEQFAIAVGPDLGASTSNESHSPSLLARIEFWERDSRVPADDPEFFVSWQAYITATL